MATPVLGIEQLGNSATTYSNGWFLLTAEYPSVVMSMMSVMVSVVSVMFEVAMMSMMSVMLKVAMAMVSMMMIKMAMSVVMLEMAMPVVTMVAVVTMVSVVSMMSVTVMAVVSYEPVSMTSHNTEKAGRGEHCELQEKTNRVRDPYFAAAF